MKEKWSDISKFFREVTCDQEKEKGSNELLIFGRWAGVVCIKFGIHSGDT
jgi:hypothetical protein